MPRKIEISHRTIVFTVLLLLFLWLLYNIRDIILQFFLALLVMTILNPVVASLARYRVPRGVSLLLVYGILLSLVIVVVAGIAPPLYEQTTSFVNGLPGYLANLSLPPALNDQVTTQIVSQVADLPGQVARFVLSIFSNLFSVITVLIVASYLLLTRNRLDDQLSYFLDKSAVEKVSGVLDRLEEKLGGWARGELALMALVGLMSYVGLRLLGVPFALPLAVLAALLELFPFIGPFMAAVPAVIIGMGISPLMGLATAALAFLIQHERNNPQSPLGAIDFQDAPSAGHG